MAQKRNEIKKTLGRYLSQLQNMRTEVSQVILYGSYAKGRPKEHSDIDVAVVSFAFRKMDLFERQEILSKAHHNFGEPIEAIGWTPEQARWKKGFAKEIFETGIIR